MTYTAKITLNDEEISQDSVIIEWSMDAEVTYDQSGPSITLESDEPTRIALWTRVRAAEAPDDDRYAYTVTKSAIEFKPIRPPRLSISRPSTLETGKTYVFKADTQLPYRGMEAQIKGVFTLPDGTVVEGDMAEYIPTDADLTQVDVETAYTAWIEGYREQGAEATPHPALSGLAIRVASICSAG